VGIGIALIVGGAIAAIVCWERAAALHELADIAESMRIATRCQRREDQEK
jgi:hypothetical protein